MKESWDYHYISISHENRKYTIKLLHYTGPKDVEQPREWWRVMGEDFDPRTPAASQKCFGFGLTAQAAIDSFFTRMTKEPNQHG